MLRARLSANHPEQYGIAPALLGDQSHLEIARQKLTKRRNLTVEMMNSINGISCVPPLGAFYAFPRLHKVTDDAKFVIELLKKPAWWLFMEAGSVRCQEQVILE